MLTLSVDGKEMLCVRNKTKNACSAEAKNIALSDEINLAKGK